MFNKFKRAITYICKKIKQGVKIIAEISKDIITDVSEVGKEVVSGTKDVINTVGITAVNRYADHMDKKLEFSKAVLKTVRTDIYSIFKNPTYIKNLGIVFLFTSAGLITVGLVNKEGK